MKRHWRPGRIILGVLLWAIAVLVYALWPASCWKTLPQQLIGFDEAKRLVYTMPLVEDHYELRAFDLASGTLQKTVTILPHIGRTPSNIVVNDDPGVPKADQKKLITKSWQWCLVPGNRFLIGLNEFQDSFQLVELDSGKLFKRIPNAKGMRDSLVAEVGFSDDGTCLAKRDFSYHIYVWNLNSGELVDQFDDNDFSKLIIHSHSGPVELSLDHLHVSTGQQYLAFSSIDKSVLRDMKTKTTLVQHPATCVPRILDDGLVVFAPWQIDANSKPAWYRKQTDDTWLRSPLKLDTGDKKYEFVCYAGNLLVTQLKEETPSEQLNWLPEWLWSKANQILHFSGTKRLIQFWDLKTGLLQRQCTLFEADDAPSSNRAARFAQRMRQMSAHLNISQDGNWMVRSDNGQLFVLDISGRRSAFFWFTFITIITLALWLAWPRRVKLAQGS